MIDSLNFIPMSLADMPKSLVKQNWSRVTFLFNRTKNKHAVLAHLPDIRYYTPDNIKPEARRDFLQWYELHKNTPFDFKKEFLRYCESDVDILKWS